LHGDDNPIPRNLTEDQCDKTFLIIVNTTESTQIYRGADKSLARPGRKQATGTEDFVFHISYL